MGCAADVPAGILQFSTDGVWVSPATFTGVQCAGTPATTLATECLLQCPFRKASIYPAVSGQMTATFKIRPEDC